MRVTVFWYDMNARGSWGGLVPLYQSKKWRRPLGTVLISVILVRHERSLWIKINQRVRWGGGENPERGRRIQPPLINPNPIKK